MVLLFQLVDVTWLAPAIVQNTVEVQMHSMFTVILRVVPVPHRLSALGYLLGATSKFTLPFQLISSLIPHLFSVIQWPPGFSQTMSMSMVK
jgi:hypothetical protein